MVAFRIRLVVKVAITAFEQNYIARTKLAIVLLPFFDMLHEYERGNARLSGIEQLSNVDYARFADKLERFCLVGVFKAEFTLPLKIRARSGN